MNTPLIILTFFDKIDPIQRKGHALMDKQQNFWDDENWLIIFCFLIQRYAETGKMLRELEKELRLSNRFFPESKMIDTINLLAETSAIHLKKGTILYRCRLVSKENEDKLFGKFSGELLELFRSFIPTFDDKGGTDQELTFALYFEAHPEELPRWEIARKQFMDIHSNVSFWGYDEENSDVPPVGTASPGRINPDGIRYLYTADDIRTAILEVRPVPTQCVSVAQVEILEDISIFSFAKPLEIDSGGENLLSCVDYDEISRYFATPNYGGKSYYLATQYISEYIKHMKNPDGQTMFDGLCFRSSLNPDGTNYVLFDVSDDTKKYRICNSSLCQVKDLLGNFEYILPMPVSESKE